MTKPSPSSIFIALKANEIGIDVYEFSDSLNKADPDYVQKWLDVLWETGVVNRLKEKEGEFLPLPLYGKAGLTGSAVEQVIRVLDDAGSAPKDDALPRLREKLRAVVEADKADRADRERREMAEKWEKGELSWKDVARVFDFLALQKDRSPITVQELVIFLFPGAKDSDKKDYARLAGFFVQCLIQLGIAEKPSSARTFSYSLVSGIDPSNLDQVEDIRAFILNIKASPGGLRTDEEDIPGKLSAMLKDWASGKAAFKPGDKPDNSWQKTGSLFGKIAVAGKPLTLEECVPMAEEKDPAALEAALDALVRCGAVMKYRSSGKEPLYSARRLARGQKYGNIVSLLGNVPTPPARTDMAVLKKKILAAYSGARTWGNVMSLVPLLVNMNEVYMVLIKEGLRDDRRYTPEEFGAFESEMMASYGMAKEAFDRDLIVPMMAGKYGLGPSTSALLWHRMANLEKYGRDAEPWTFNVNSVFGYLKMIQKSLMEKQGLPEKEKALMDAVSAVKADALEVDLFILEELGILAVAGRDYCYSLAKFFDPAEVSSRIARLGGNFRNVPVSVIHMQKVRNVLFGDVPPTWPLAGFVFSSLQAAPDNKISGRDLLSNLGPGVDKGSWNMFHAVLLYLARAGLVKPFSAPSTARLPSTGEEFESTVFEALGLSGAEKERFMSFIGKIGFLSRRDLGKIFAEQPDRDEVIRSLREKNIIDNMGRLTPVFSEVKGYNGLVLAPSMEKKSSFTMEKRRLLYRKLEEAYKELTFSGDGLSLERARRKVALKVIGPNLRGALYVYEAIRDTMNKKGGAAGTPEYPDFADILAELEDISPEGLNAYLVFLRESGLVEKIGERYFRTARMYGGQMDEIRRLFDDMAVRIDTADVSAMKSVTTRVLSITEPLWGSRFSDDLRRVMKKLGESAPASEADRTIVLAFDKGWLPKAQEKQLLDVIRAMGKKANILTVLSDDASKLPVNIHNTISEKGIPWANVITFVGRDILERGNLCSASNPFLESYIRCDRDKKSHIIGVDSSNLSDDSYVRLIEMVSMAFEHAFNIWDAPLRHPHIDAIIAETKDPPMLRLKYILFVPDVEKIDIDLIPEVYSAQVERVSTSA